MKLDWIASLPRLGGRRPVREPADLRYTFCIKYLSPIGDRHANYQHVLRHSHPDVLGRACATPFHATYGEFKASIDIRLLTISEGNLPQRAAELVLDWAELHPRELLEDWDLCRKKKHPKPIEPLK
jgi:hypothetical protein